MGVRVDPQFLTEIKKYGALNVEKCFNCGNCTAVCSLTSNEAQFPRRIIHMAQLGLRDHLLGSKELWLCYNCGKCSETCPQQAEPANLMAAARCYAITNYDPLGIGKLFCTVPLVGGLIAVLMVLFFGAFMYTQRETMSTESLKLFNFIPYEFIHTVGIVAMILVALASLLAIFNMISRMARANDITIKSITSGSRMNWLAAFWEAVGIQALWQKRYREECDVEENRKVWYLSKWFVHAATMWGFLGLLSATALDYLLDILGLKPTGTAVPIWYPTRLLGTLAGLLFTYGVTVLLIKRWRAVDKAHSYSRPSDYIFLTLLWLSGVTGFIIEIALYLPGAPQWGYWMFIFHVAVSITLLLLLPFTKFAHAIYRIVALYFHALKPIPATEPAKAGTD
jgi:quinone-modifying oxidoreductase, subunit QmoC